MRFALSDDQILLRRGVRQALARACPPEAVRAAWEAGPSRERWRELAGAGVLGMLVPEALGGQGLTEVELAIALEEAGRIALPEPLVETAGVAAPLLAGTPLAREWLPRVARGEAIVAVGLGGAPFVVDAAAADLLLLEDGAGVHALARSAVTLEPASSVDGARRLYRVGWRAEDGVRVADPGAGGDHGALGAAAFLVGLARHLLDVTVEYVTVRRQFGRPVGSFQAVKHHLADVRVGVDLAAPVVLRAAVAMAEREPTAPARVSMAKAFASDAATRVARTALQCHGAIGYAFEGSLHLWMKRVWALAASWGDAAWHRSRIAVQIIERRLEFPNGGSDV